MSSSPGQTPTRRFYFTCLACGRNQRTRARVGRTHTCRACGHVNPGLAMIRQQFGVTALAKAEPAPENGAHQVVTAPGRVGATASTAAEAPGEEVASVPSTSSESVPAAPPPSPAAARSYKPVIGAPAAKAGKRSRGTPAPAVKAAPAAAAAESQPNPEPVPAESQPEPVAAPASNGLGPGPVGRRGLMDRILYGSADDG